MKNTIFEYIKEIKFIYILLVGCFENYYASTEPNDISYRGYYSCMDSSRKGYGKREYDNIEEIS